MRFPFAEKCKNIIAIAPVAADASAARQGDWVSFAGAGRIFVEVVISQKNAATSKITLLQATDNAGTGSKAISNAVPIWANQDASASEVLTRQDNAVDFTTDAALKDKVVVFQLDPDEVLDTQNGFSHISVSVGASNAANIVSAKYVATDLRYGAQEAPYLTE